MGNRDRFRKMYCIPNWVMLLLKGFVFLNYYRSCPLSFGYN